MSTAIEDDVDLPPRQRAEERYVRDLLARGEAHIRQAGEVTEDELPPGVTHTLEVKEGEEPTLERERFSAF